MSHAEAHELAGKTVELRLAKAAPNVDDGDLFTVEDWWDRVTGKSWMVSDGNPAAMLYGMRSGLAGLPIDDEVVYGKVGRLGHLVHVSELGEVHS